MDSAREFAEKLAQPVYIQGQGMVAMKPPTVAEAIAARDADLWRMAQEQIRLKIAQRMCVFCVNGDEHKTHAAPAGTILSIPLDPLPVDKGEK